MPAATSSSISVQEQLLRKIGAFFSTQRSELFFSCIHDSLLKTDLYQSYESTPFWKNHPEGHFVFKVLFKCFRKHLPVLKNNAASLESTFTRIKHDTLKYLLEELSALTYNVDIDYIIALSGEDYESHTPSAQRLAVFRGCDRRQFCSHTALLFDHKLPLTQENIHAVRKQLNLANHGSLAISLNHDTGSFETVGVLAHSAYDAHPYFQFEGHLKWSFCVPSAPPNKNGQHSHCIIRFCQGTFMFPIIDLTSEISKTLTRIFPDRLELSNVTKMVSSIAACKKGTVLIVSDTETIVNESERLAKIGCRGTFLQISKNVMEKWNRGLLEQFASIDGATLVDYSGNCYAFGVILDGCFNDGIITGERGRGARYNSTQLYVKSTKLKENANILGVIKSEDGMLDLITSGL